MNKKYIKIAAFVFLLACISSLLLLPKKDEIRLLYATNGDEYDHSAFLGFQQSTLANLRMDRFSLGSINPQKFKSYDAIYVDVSLHESDMLKQAAGSLQAYVEQGGHLLLENEFVVDFPLSFIGAERIVDVPVHAQPLFDYPEVGVNLQGIQTTFRLFSDNFFKHSSTSSMPGFHWGKGIIPSTAQSLVDLDGVSLYTANRSGKGTVFMASIFLPNRYFITGFDLQSGMDESDGFPQLIEAHREKYAGRTVNAAYFDLAQIQPEPFFHFAFAAANTMFRTEYLSFIAKEKHGYSVKKIFGPYGRPAMAYQNHFEALPAIRDLEGIQWAEFLKPYDQIPSFSLIRSSFDWGQWKESITVQLNTSSTDTPIFVGELPYSYYSSGTHLVSGEGPLSLAHYPEYKSLGDPINLPYRAYPAIADIDGDGKPVLLAGSADGYIYLYRTAARDIYPEYARQDQEIPAGVEPPQAFEKPVELMLESGEPLHVGTFATIATFDADEEGDRHSLLIGTGEGAILYSHNIGGGRFAVPVPKNDTQGKPIRVDANAAPAYGDIDGSGVPSLIVGEADGRVHLFQGVHGDPLTFEPGRVLFQIDAKYAAPSIKDMNGDGIPDLVIGNSEGDLLVYLQEADGWKLLGPIEGSTTNQLGTKAIVSGHNSVPLWYDINGDDQIDLLVGQLEFGMPFAVDDPNFPYQNELRQFIDYSKANHLEIYPHFFVHNYVNDEQEKQEIALHEQAFKKWGIPWGNTGTNQHTWRIHNPDRLQTLRNQSEHGFWFNFGFAPSYSQSTPSWGEDYIWGIPFLLQDDQLNQPMALYTPAPYLRLGGPYANEDIYDSFISLDMPINYFYHIEYHFPQRVNELRQFVEYFDHLRTEYNYNFMTEPQMAKSFLVTLTAAVEVSQSWGGYLWDKLKDRIGRGVHFTRILKPNIASVPDQAAEYLHTLGVVIEPGERLAHHPLRSSNEIFTQQKSNLYTGVSRKTSVSVDWRPEPMHIVRSNVPIKVIKEQDQWILHLGSPGMQQVKLYSPEPLTFADDELKVNYNADKQTYTLTRYGDRATIIVKKTEE